MLIPATPRLRRHAIAVLALFVVALLAAIAAPWVHPAQYEKLCSAQGDRWVKSTVGDDGTSGDMGEHGAHCPLCLAAGAPPSVFMWTPDAPAPSAIVQTRLEATRLASLVGASLPARGPPLPA